MLPPLSEQRRNERDLPEVVPVMGPWLRGLLVVMVIGLLGVFGLAIWLDPYEGDGEPKRMETHRQLGLPPCTLRTVTGVPCPSCGMTTSFALLMRGDLVNSLRANSVGTLLALFWLALIPWGLLSAWRAKPVFIRSIERALTWIVLVFLVLTLLRWGFVVGAGWLTGSF